MAVPRIYKVEGIILKRRNTGETDRIVTVFTKQYGKLRILAKGVRRVTSRRGPHLEIFSHVVLLVHRGKTLDTVSEIVPITTFETIRVDLERISVGYFYCELVNTLLAEKQEHLDVFSLLLNALQQLNRDHSDNIYNHSKHFALELLWILGFLPRSKSMGGKKLQDFVESIAEKRLHTPHFVRRLLS